MAVSIEMGLMLLLGYVVSALESPLLYSLHVSLYAPNLVLGIVLYLSLRAPIAMGAVTVFLLGLIRDGFSGGGLVGMHSEIYLVIYLLGIFLSHRLDFRTPIIFMIVTGVASLLASLLFFVFSAIFDQMFNQFDLVFRLMIPQAIIAAPFGPAMAGLCGLMSRMTERRETGRSGRLS